MIMKKIGELNALKGHFVLYYDSNEAHNHYKIYLKWYDTGWHRKLIEKYADLFSCTMWISNYIAKNNEDGR